LTGSPLRVHTRGLRTGYSLPPTALGVNDPMALTLLRRYGTALLEYAPEHVWSG
jgi:hypothetical protein